MYDKAPQNPQRLKPGRLRNQLDQDIGDPQLYTVEQIIERAESGDANCIEWLYGDLNIPRNELPKDFYRCSQCNLGKHKTEFTRDARKSNGLQSHCKSCHAYNMQKARMMTRIKAVEREVKRVYGNVL